MDEEELEDEFIQLEIKEDFGEEDSDTTPTNTPPTTARVNLIHFPISSNTSGFYDGESTRYSSEDYDLRSESSLSWGEDEFEGEATRIVNQLFDQLDEIIYSEDKQSRSLQLPLLKSVINKPKSIPLSSEKKVEIKGSSVVPNELSSYVHIRENSYTADEAYGSPVRESISVPEPSVNLLNEVKEWVSNFPHLRINGIGVDMMKLMQLESYILHEGDEIVSMKLKDDPVGEEIFAKNGDYENKLHFITLKPELSIEKKKDSVKKSKGPPSRICSGTTDPEVLKEQLLIRLFESLWPVVSQIVEPLLNQYAQHLIKYSAQYSSLSRESSKTGSRDVPMFHPISQSSSLLNRSINLKDQKQVILKGVGNLPSVGWNNVKPTSAIYKQTNKVPTRNIDEDELTTLLHITSKPLQSAEERVITRSLSASRIREISSKFSSPMISLPLLNNLHRPVSSRSGSHLLTPRPTSEQRPASTSSYARSRFGDKLHAINRSATIEEGKAYDRSTDQLEKIEDMESQSPTWSRHNSFLPPINDLAKTKFQHGAGNPNVHSFTTKSAKVKSSSAASTNATNQTQAEPFVNWIVSKVEEQISPPVVLDRVSPEWKNKCSVKISNNSPIDKTKHFKRSSHH